MVENERKITKEKDKFKMTMSSIFERKEFEQELAKMKEQHVAIIKHMEMATKDLGEVEKIIAEMEKLLK